MFKQALTFTALFGLLLTPPAFAQTIFVDVSQTTGANDGSSWINAFQGADGLQSALAVAATGNQVWVAQGTYIPTTTGARNVYFRLLDGVEVYGGFDGTELMLVERDFVANETILSGDLLGDDLTGGSNAENSFHVVHANGSDSSAVLDGFTVTRGRANNSAANRDRGAGILCVGGVSSTIRNCVFTANSCTFGGGAGYINSSSPSFSDCTFDSNVGGNFGGAFDMANSVQASFDRCVFSNNSAARAGGIEIFGSSAVKVSDSLFFQNTATGGSGGGAIWISGSAPHIRNCTIVANTSPSSVAAGIQAGSGTPLIVNCVVDGNTGSGGSTGISSQINPANLNVTYTLTAAGYSGAGNVAAIPLFENCGPHPFALSTSSAGVDAGENAGVAPGSTTDLAGGPRLFDVAGVSNSGAGGSPLVDMGAYETGFDCNGNGVSDLCDVALGTSPDVNGNGLPDECECSGGAVPFVYCTAKVNSQGCLTAISSSGIASAAGVLPFPIRASKVLNQSVGILFYGYQGAATPFQGGFLCVQPPTLRLPPMTSGGSPAGADCTGAFSLDFNAYIATGFDPLLANVGQQVNAQYWSRDPASPSTTNLTDAVQFQLCQ